jgi:hypothetical protein
MSRSPSTVTPTTTYTGSLATLPVTDLDDHRIDEDHGIHLLQRPAQPLHHLARDLLGDPADRVLGDPGAVHLMEVRRDPPRRQPTRSERQDDLIDPREAPLALLDDPRLERRDSVSRGTSTSTGPISVSTVLARVPLRLFPLLRPAESCFS